MGRTKYEIISISARIGRNASGARESRTGSETCAVLDETKDGYGQEHRHRHHRGHCDMALSW